MSEEKTLKQLTEEIAKALVDNEEAVEVTETPGEQTQIIELKVDKKDIGKIIGKSGRTVRAMRTILTGAAAKKRKRSILEIIE